MRYIRVRQSADHHVNILVAEHLNNNSGVQKSFETVAPAAHATNNEGDVISFRCQWCGDNNEFPRGGSPAQLAPGYAVAFVTVSLP